MRKGKNTKRPPSKKLLQSIAEQLDAPNNLEANLQMAKERFLPDEEKSFIPASIVNMSGGCYYHPFKKKSEIPNNHQDYLDSLTKIVDCEVRVLEAIEYVTEQQGRMADDKEVRYKLELNDKHGKQVVTEVTHEELTRISHSNFINLYRNNWRQYIESILGDYKE